MLQSYSVTVYSITYISLKVSGSIAGHIVPIPVSPKDNTVLLRVYIPIVGCAGPLVVVAAAGPVSLGVGALRQDVIKTRHYPPWPARSPPCGHRHCY